MMQIEFYLPLPTLSGFIGFAIIYYMLGLAVTVYYVVKWDIEHRKGIAWSNLNLPVMLLFVASAWIRPELPISYYRNRWRDDMQSLKRGAGQK